MQARRVMYDSYAEDVMRAHGVHIWDVYATCKMGTYKVHDQVHADALTIWAMNYDMLDTLACPVA